MPLHCGSTCAHHGKKGCTGFAVMREMATTGIAMLAQKRPERGGAITTISIILQRRLRRYYVQKLYGKICA
jgi:hypothetical protein